MSNGDGMMNERVDRMGAVASTVCAVHCGLCALLPVAFSALGLSFLVGHKAEWIFTMIAIVFALGALVLGWRQHGSVRVVSILALGVVGLLASRGLEMGGHHGDHHGAHERGHVEPSEGHAHDHREHKDHGHQEVHAEEGAKAHDHHGHAAHLAGAAVGVIAGFLLLMGHLLNIRTTRRCREECCT